MNIQILDRYLAKHVISVILMVSLALLGIDLFFNLVNELKAVGKGAYTVNLMLSYLALTLPTHFYMMFPWSALIGTLVALSILANHRELVVMRTASISVFRITYAVIKAAFIVIVFVLILGEGVAPATERIAQNIRTFALSGGQSIQTPYGLWIRQGEEFIHIQTVKNDGGLGGITRYHFDNHRKLKEVTIAQAAIKENGQWHLSGITGTRFLKDKTEIIEEEHQYVKNLLEPEILEAATVKHPERLSLPALWRTIKHRSENELNTKNYELAFFTKIFQPLLIMIMVFLAVPFVFGPLRSASMGFRILAGIFVAYAFHTINGMVAPLALVYQIPALIAVLLPLLLFAGLGFGLLKRVK